jgi:hypothetical protein
MEVYIMSNPSRRELLQGVRDHVARSGDPSLPWESLPGLQEEFRDTDDVILALHQRWYARFAAHLDGMLENPPDDLPGAVYELWERLTADDPAGRYLLDAYRTRPAVARAEEQQRLLLAQATAGELPQLPHACDKPDLATTGGDHRERAHRTASRRESRGRARCLLAARPRSGARGADSAATHERTAARHLGFPHRR